MPRKIIDLVRDKKARMEKRTPEGIEEANKNAQLSIAAIPGGIQSPAWRTYMLQFVDKDDAGNEIDPRQLRRLLATDGTAGDADQDLRRVYLVSNGPCGPNSPDGLGFDFAVESIDEGLGDPCFEPTFRTEDLPATRINAEARKLL